MKRSLYIRGMSSLLSLVLFVSVFTGVVPAAESVEPVKLKVLLLPFLVFGPFLIAEEEGYFAEQGLEVEFVKMQGSEKAIPALIQGDLDIIAGNPGISLLNAMARGGAIKIVANKGYIDSPDCAAYALLARRALVEAEELNDPSQLQGKKLAIEVLSPDGYYMEKLLTKSGLTLDDIKTEDIPPPVIVKAFKSGSIDVAHVSEPWVTRILRLGDAVLWLPVKEVIPEFPWTVITYGRNILENNPDAGKRFMVAYLKAVRQYNQGKTERNIEILAKHTGIEHDLLQEACWPAIRNDGHINVESVLDFQNWGLKMGLLDKVIPEDQFWDGSFLEYALKETGKTSK